VIISEIFSLVFRENHFWKDLLACITFFGVITYHLVLAQTFSRNLVQLTEIWYAINTERTFFPTANCVLVKVLASAVAVMSSRELVACH
jgi:hypothetical protein